MPLLTTSIIAAALALALTPAPAPRPVPAPGGQALQRIDVDCQSGGSLDRAISKAAKLGKVDIYLHGVCEGNFVIAADGITLRGATSDSGLAAPDGGANRLPVLEVDDAQAELRGLVVRGGEVGVLVRGWNAEVFLGEVDVYGQIVGGAGVVAIRGAMVQLLDSTVRDGNIGIVAESSSEINLQGVVVNNQRIGVVVTGESNAALSNATTIANNHEAGLIVDTRSDVNIFDTAFRDNGQVHIDAGEWSEVNVVSGVTVGSADDTTSYSLGAIRGATIASYSTPAIYGNVSVLDGGSIQFGNTVLNGYLALALFAKVYVQNATITGLVFCADGSDAICAGVTTGGAIGCPSTTCGQPPQATDGRGSALPGYPAIEVPRFDLPRRARPPN
jgi:hypothetical protein